MIYLDTHTIVRLYQGRLGKVGDAARRMIERDDVYLPPAAILELEFLHETGRLTVGAMDIVSDLCAELDARVCDAPFASIARIAVREGWTRDPFDRLIVANARLMNAPLATQDATIQKHYSRSVW